MLNPGNSRIIVITGPKHAGKTAMGRAAASLLEGEFIDLDERIAAETGKSPRALFKEGPALFRQAEARALAGLTGDAGGDDGALPCRVIAAGGGIIDNPEAQALLAGDGRFILVYLEVSAKTAWERIRRAAAASGELPPFLDTKNPRETHRRLHKRRGAAYKKAARFTLAGENKSPEALGAELRELLRGSGFLEVLKSPAFSDTR
jgi:shikimate kinase